MEQLLARFSDSPVSRRSVATPRCQAFVCYDKSGNVVAVGLEANADTNPDLLGDDGLVTAEWFYQKWTALLT